MKNNPLFFLAILPPPDGQAEITALKHFIAATWGPRHALKSPPHITLQPPFRWPMAHLPMLRAALTDFATAQVPFEIKLENFGAFPPRVVFIQPLESAALEGLFQHLVAHLNHVLGFTDARNQCPFHPHLTLAHRDVTERQFPALWADFQERKFEQTFLVQSLALLESIAGYWKVREEFAFGGR